MTQHDIAEIAGKLQGAHRRLVERVGSRWVKGTGFCHRSVGFDLERLGLVESRTKRNEREIRATETGLAVRAYLKEQQG